MMEYVQECYSKRVISETPEGRQYMRRRTELFFLECKENGIDEFDVFDVIVDNVV